MTNELFSIHSLWQNQPASPIVFSLEEIHRKARTFQQTIHSYSMLGYGLLYSLLLFFFCSFFFCSNPMQRIGVGLCFASFIYLIFQVKYTSARKVPDELVLESCLHFYRSELERYRRLLHSWRPWINFLSPFPGIIIFQIGLAGTDPKALIAVYLSIGLSILLVPLFIYIKNIRFQEVEREINLLDAAKTGSLERGER